MQKVSRSFKGGLIFVVSIFLLATPFFIQNVWTAPEDDVDGDGILNGVDICPNVANPDQTDADGDGVGDVCDNCASTANVDQGDNDGDSVGNACDNCPNISNQNQADANNNGIGDVCEGSEPFQPTGKITNPATDYEVVSGIINLIAEYDDGDQNNDDIVNWAVRKGTCAPATGTVFGNVDGYNNSYTWDGTNFSTDFDAGKYEPGDYCFVFNPRDDEEPTTDVRETRRFTIADKPEVNECNLDNILLNGSFEARSSNIIGLIHGSALDSLNTSWDVYGMLPDITDGNGTSWFDDSEKGAGIEVDYNGIASGIPAKEGSYYTELDTHTRDGITAADTNTKISQNVELDGGNYVLSFYYYARTTNANDNTVEFLFDDEVLETADGTEPGWVEISVNLNNVEEGIHKVSFQGAGTASTFGGLVDQVSLLCGLPTPECGNGIPEEGEECDDGNEIETDECSSSCTIIEPEPEPVCQFKVEYIEDGFMNVEPGDLAENVYVGVNETPFALNEWIPLDTTDANLNKDVPGLAIQRLEKSLLVYLYGRHKEGGAEYVYARVTINNGYFTGIENDKFEKWNQEGHEFGKAGNDEAYFDLSSPRFSDFVAGVTTGDDSYSISYVCGELPDSCGDGKQNPGEQCDDGNTEDGDGCSATCEIQAYCGDGNVDDGEECDDGNNQNQDGCSSTCEFDEPSCKFKINFNEIENKNGGDMSSAIYVGLDDVPPVAEGDWVSLYQTDAGLKEGAKGLAVQRTADKEIRVFLYGSHEKVAGVPIAQESVDGLVTIEGGVFTGIRNDESSNNSFEKWNEDGHVFGNASNDEAYFDASEPKVSRFVSSVTTANDSYYISYTCDPIGGEGSTCGDGTLDPGEGCDDGNTYNGDGCSSVCIDESGSGGEPTPTAECGDGTVDDDEQCDDSNTKDGDGCSATCLNETLECDEVSFIDPFENVDGDTSGWSVDNTRVDLKVTSWPFLNGLGLIRAERHTGAENLSQRGTRGMGVMGGEDDEVDFQNESQEKLFLTFEEPVYLDWMQIYSMFVFDNGTKEVGTIDLLLDSSQVGQKQISGVETTKDGYFGIVDADFDLIKVDEIRAYVPADVTTTLSSNFALGKLQVCKYHTPEGEGGEGGNENHDLTIFNETISAVDSGSVTVTWETNVPATSRVVFGKNSVDELITCDEEAPTGTCKYGYSLTSDEDGTMVISHSLKINGLDAGEQYYFRPISHASPEVLGVELTATTDPVSGGGDGGSGGGSGSGGDSGSSGGSSPSSPSGSGSGDASAPQGVLGEKINDEEGDSDSVNPVLSDSEDLESGVGGDAPKEVLGYETLPEAGSNTFAFSLSLILAGLAFSRIAWVINRKEEV